MLHFLRANLWLVLIVLAVVTGAILVVDPVPSRELTLATGQPNGAYHAFAVRLADKLQAQGLTVHLRTTKGSVENLQLLGDTGSGVSIALVQSGVPAANNSGFRSLGALFYEPLWVFTKRGQHFETMLDLRGRRIAAGAEGSGTLPVVMEVLEANGLVSENDAAVTIERIGGDEAAAALRAGTVDVACFVGAPSGELIRQLLHDPGLDFHGMRRGRAYEAAFPNFATLTIGEGQLDLAANIPAEDRTVLSSAVSFVVNGEFHRGFTPAVLEAAAELLREGSALEKPGAFPAPRPTDYPLLAEASHYHKHGPPFLMRYLPFWAATVAFRVFILVVPLLAVLIPLIRIAPPIYAWRTRRRIFRWYSHLREIDQHLSARAGIGQIESDIARVYALQDEILKVKVPHSYADELYDLHLHIEWVIRRLERAKAAAAG
jgi:hypothetical protein